MKDKNKKDDTSYDGLEKPKILIVQDDEGELLTIKIEEYDK